MNVTQLIDAFLASQTGQLALWVLLLPVIDFVLGILAAVRDGTFRLDAVASFIRKHIAGRILPIWLLLILGYASEGITLPVVGWPALTTVGLAAAGVYIAETIGSILKSWGPPTPDGGYSLVARDPVQPVPRD